MSLLDNVLLHPLTSEVVPSRPITSTELMDITFGEPMPTFSVPPLSGRARAVDYLSHERMSQCDAMEQYKISKPELATLSFASK